MFLDGLGLGFAPVVGVEPSARWTKISRPFDVCGVGGGIRTLGHWNHNPALYQLSYTHHEGDILIVSR